MTDVEAINRVASLRVTAMSQRNQEAFDALDRVLALVRARGEAVCGCGHENKRHMACEVRICGCSGFKPLEGHAQ